MIPEHLPPLGRDRDGAGALDAAYPALVQAVRADRCADGTCQMWSPFAPVEASRHSTLAQRLPLVVASASTSRPTRARIVKPASVITPASLVNLA